MKRPRQRYIHQTVEVDVELCIDDLVEDLDDDAKTALGKALGVDTAAGLSGAGDGDLARRENLIERGYLAARGLPQVPRELADMFYLVHGRALA